MRFTYFQSIIFFIVSAMVFLNLTIYLPIVHIFPLPAYVLDLLIFSAFFLYYIKKKLPFPYQNKLFLWLLLHVVLNTIYYINSPAGPRELVYYKIMTFFIFVFVYLVMFFNMDDGKLSHIRKAMIPLGIVASLSLAYEYIEPGYFIKILSNGHIEYIAGRASAYYLNANIAGGAMVIFLIFTIDYISHRYKILYIFILFLGLFSTMSRSNIMLFFIILIFMFFQKKLHGKHLSILLVGIVSFFLWLSVGGLDYLSEKYDFQVTENMKSRIDFFANSKKSDTSDIGPRTMVLRRALEMFADNPVLGAGYAATRLWQYQWSPHNTFAEHWAEFGILGILIIPLLLYLISIDIFRYGDTNQKQMTVLVIIYFVGACFFSHNMLEQPLNVATLVAISVMGYKARFKKRDL